MRVNRICTVCTYSESLLVLCTVFQKGQPETREILYVDMDLGYLIWIRIGLSLHFVIFELSDILAHFDLDWIWFVDFESTNFWSNMLVMSKQATL